MKFLKRALVVVLSIILATGVFGAFAGCQKKVAEGVLTIRYFIGGFGKEWLESAAEKFQEQNPEVKDVDLIDDANIRNNAATYLRSNVPDIIMSQNLAWSSFVQSGLLEPLNEVYEAEVVTSEGTTTVGEYLDDDFANYGYMQRIAGQGDSYPWVIPWSVLTCSIAYNVDILESTSRRSTPGENWKEPPATVSELVEYVGDINAKGDVLPFTWGGGGYNWLLFPGYVWWAQIQGVDESNIPGEGSFYDFWEFQSAEVYQQTGIQAMLDIIRDLVIDESTGNWKNSPDRLEELSTTDVELDFVNGEAAMCFAGSWLENEMKDFIPENFNMVMMETPVVDDAYLEILGLDGVTVDQEKVINNANAGDVMFIPANATNKELAKEFLAFLCSEEMLVEFTEFTGMMRPFEYNPLTSTYKDPAKEYSDFTQSCFNLYMNCDANLFEFPKNASLKQQQDPTFNTYIYTYKRPELFQEVTLTTAITKLKTLTGEEVMVTGGPNYESVYTRVSKEFPKWESELGLA